MMRWVKVVFWSVVLILALMAIVLPLLAVVLALLAVVAIVFFLGFVVYKFRRGWV